MAGESYFVNQKLVTEESKDEDNYACNFAKRQHLFRPALLDMIGEAAQRGEYFGVILVI